MAIVTRAGKGSQLTHAELDTNFTDLRDGVALMVPKTQGTGIKLDSLGTPGFGWHDLIGEIHVHEGDPAAPTSAAWVGGVKQFQYSVGDECHVQFHMPHDYVMGTDVYIHVHWSHNATTVTGGSLTWAWELAYAKGHNQASFSGSTILVSEIQNASTIQRQHMICEAPISILGGAANLFDNADLEVDGLIIGRMYLSANNLTVSGGGVPEPFVHGIDVHYQSTGVPTKQRAPDFWT